MKWPTNRRGSRHDSNVIDAGEVLADREREREEALIEGERGAPELTGRGRSAAGAKPLLLAGGAVALLIGGVVVAKNLDDKPTDDKKSAEQAMVVKNPKAGFKPTPLTDAEAQRADAMGGGLGDDGAIEPVMVAGADPNAPAFPASGPVPLTAASGQHTVPALATAPGGAPATSAGPPQPKPLTAAEIVHLRRLGGGLRDQGPSAQASLDNGGRQLPPPRAEADEGELAKALRPIKLAGEKAGNLGNRDFLLTQGSMLDCVLETRLESSVAGMTSCHLTRDVYSANGRVLLLDKGSKVVGFYQGGIRQGQRRIFVQWSRIETPKGVVVNIQSPGTGSLGTGGVDGFIDNHFGERFGASILLSLIGDLGDYVANKGNSGGQVQFQNSQDGAQQMARTALEASINIPPTLTKNQGDRVSIFVARDLDFTGVYKLASR